jgi:hypothetical protein
MRGIMKEGIGHAFNNFWILATFHKIENRGSSWTRDGIQEKERICLDCG